MQAAWHAAAIGAGRLVRFTGAVPDPAPLYAAADVYVQPTFYDPCSLVALEALASGLPLVTSRYNGVAELLTDGQEGYVLQDPARADELVWRLESLLPPARRDAMGRAARQLALRHTFAQNVDEILAIYQQLSRRRVAA